MPPPLLQQPTTASRRSRRGGIYVVSLITAALVGMVGMSAVTLRMNERRQAMLAADATKARVAALSALELAAHVIRTDDSWRTNSSLNVVNRPLGDATFSVIVSDPDDGDLTSGENAAVIVRSTAVAGAARQVATVRLQRFHAPLGCLYYGLAAGNRILVNNGGPRSDRVVTSNSRVDIVSAALNADAEAPLLVPLLGSHHGNFTISLRPVDIPSTTVIDTWVARGTAVNMGNVPIESSNYVIRNRLFSPASNPFGPDTNANGIYVLDLANRRTIIRECRIVGTLILLNPGPSSSIMGSNNWVAIGNAPALLIRGAMGISMSASNLSESVTNTNFNPHGTPYLGHSNASNTDSYPSLIKGIIYSTGNLLLDTQSQTTGVVISSGQITFAGSAVHTYDSVYTQNPPTGFSSLTPFLVAEGGPRFISD